MREKQPFLYSSRKSVDVATTPLHHATAHHAIGLSMVAIVGVMV